VHRALLATRSTFFEGACRNGFKEAATGIIDLTEDDAEAVEHMVHCKCERSTSPYDDDANRVLDFYHLDYLNNITKPLSRRSSQRSNRSSSPRTSRFPRKNLPKKLNFAMDEDPLLALLAATNNSMPLTPPADEPAFQNFDTSTKLPDTPMADQFDDDDLESVQSEVEFDTERGQLVTHAKVYAIAEKYVPLFVNFPLSSFSLVMHNSLPNSFHLRLQIYLSMAAMCCIAGGLKHRSGRRFASPACLHTQSQRAVHQTSCQISAPHAVLSMLLCTIS
jgi:hypothetical protein